MMSEPVYKQLNELKHIVAVWSFKAHEWNFESMPVKITHKEDMFYISVLDYATTDIIYLQRQREEGARPFASLNTAYSVIRQNLNWKGKIELEIA